MLLVFAFNAEAATPPAIPIAGIAVAPSVASTCTGSERLWIDRAVAKVATLPTARGGVQHARDLVGRSSAQCRFGRLAYAVALQTKRTVPTPKARGSVGRVQLVGTATGWVLDPVQTARSVRSDPDPADAARSVSSLAIATRPGRLMWSADPTAFKASPQIQASTARELANSKASQLRALAISSARGMTHASMQAVLGRQLVHASFGHVVSVQRIASADPGIRLLADQTARRTGRASIGPWPRYGTRWVTRAEALALHRAAAVHARIRPTSYSRSLSRKLTAMVKTAPKIRFERVPGPVFYPWPRDGVRDSVEVRVRIDKPGTAVVRIYDRTGVVRATRKSIVDPGLWSPSWDGSLDAGGLAAAGAYRWSITVTDIAGNGRGLPGPSTFTVARDTTPPRIIMATTKLAARRGSSALIDASWKIDEPLSPNVTVQLVVRGPARKAAALGKTLEGNGQATFAGLPRGTYRAYLRVYDGSGNVRLAPAGRITLSS